MDRVWWSWLLWLLHRRRHRHDIARDGTWTFAMSVLLMCLYVVIVVFIVKSYMLGSLLHQNRLNHGIYSNGEFNESNYSRRRNLRVTWFPFAILFWNFILELNFGSGHKTRDGTTMTDKDTKWFIRIEKR